jgi:NADPH:quinone reductase-like Zn-dependent oxidoreductase
MAIQDVARITTKKRVLVLGATGGLGGSIGRLAQRRGVAQLMGVFGSAAKTKIAAKIGYTHVSLLSELA